MSTERTPTSEELDNHKFVDLNTLEFDEAFASAELYSKVVQVYARQIQEGEDPEVIQTILLNGVMEAKRPLHDYQPGSWIVVNPAGGERYLIDPLKFAKRYEPIDPEIGLFRGIGLNRMVPNTTGVPVGIRPPWDPNEIMKGDENCWFSTVVDPDNPDKLTDDRYIIGDLEKRLTFAIAGMGYTELDLQSKEMTEYLQREGKVVWRSGYVFLDRLEEGDTIDIVKRVPDLGPLVLAATFDLNKPDRMIVTPRKARMPYVMSAETAGERFRPVDPEHGLYQAIGAALIAPNPFPGEAIKARAAWGAMQHVASNGSLAVALGDVGPFDRTNLPTDRYLLDKLDVDLNYN